MCFTETNRLFGQYTEVKLYVFSDVFVFFKIEYVARLSNMIIDSASP